ncbi:Uncharacterised protein [Bartonella vinsonii]|uniref:Uncharacterized protein n=1 Tax=Bartonella vinsonii TaxID=33047 RepID=A0A3S4ZZ09_BARVI|nr:Uncharacterised protein [Bartonella vinsonii]
MNELKGNHFSFEIAHSFQSENMAENMGVLNFILFQDHHF